MKTILPRPPIPEDFDTQVFTRLWLRSLPIAPAPHDFDDKVVMQPYKSRLWILNSLLLAMAVALGLWLATRHHIVTVIAAPDVRTVHVDLYNIPPAPITEDMRWKQPRTSTTKPKKLVGRAGY